MAAKCKAVDPRTGATLAEYDEAQPADVDAALEAAATASLDPALADHARRARGLRAIATRLRDSEEAIVDICGAETGLPEARLRGELARTTGQLDAFAAVIERGDHLEAIIDHADPSTTPPRPDLRRALVPIGPVAVFGASNFPLAFSTAGGDTASALAAGNPVVVKGHPAHPGTGELVAAQVSAAIEDAGLPPGTFAHLLSSDNELAGKLVEHPAVQAVAFTGSLRAGQAIIDRAAGRATPIPVFAEMGSLNPIVVTEAALAARADAIADGLVKSACDFGGQLCTKPGLVLVPDGGAGDEFARAVAERVGARDVEPLLHAGIASAFANGLTALDDAGDVERLTPTGDDDENRADAGTWTRPVAYSGPLAALQSVPALAEEHFGPAVVLLRYGSVDEIAPAMENLGGQLSYTVHAEDADRDVLAPVVAAATRLSGRVVFNGFPTGVAVAWATQHGGPWPATSAPGTTSVGMTALRRFLRPVAFQDAPAEVLPPELRDDNPLGIAQRVDGQLRG